MTDTEEILALARSALALGDWFAPPYGSKVRVGYRRSVVTSCLVPVSELLYVNFMNKFAFVAYPVNGSRDDRDVYIFQGDHYELLEIPPNAPPFEQWERPANE